MEHPLSNFKAVRKCRLVTAGTSRIVVRRTSSRSQNLDEREAWEWGGKEKKKKISIIKKNVPTR